MESEDHIELKHRATKWLLDNGADNVYAEFYIQAECGSFRIDLVAYQNHAPVVGIECGNLNNSEYDYRHIPFPIINLPYEGWPCLLNRGSYHTIPMFVETFLESLPKDPRLEIIRKVDEALNKAKASTNTPLAWDYITDPNHISVLDIYYDRALRDKFINDRPINNNPIKHIFKQSPGRKSKYPWVRGEGSAPWA